jgi:hypothetical protein
MKGQPIEPPSKEKKKERIASGLNELFCIITSSDRSIRTVFKIQRVSMSNKKKIDGAVGQYESPSACPHTVQHNLEEYPSLASVCHVVV